MATTLEQPKQYGVTKPISLTPSIPAEIQATESMIQELKAQDTFESEEGTRLREQVLGRVASLVKRFVKEVGVRAGMSESAAAAAGGKIFTFGSFRLGVHGPGSDIDTLCVVPKHVTRDDFFDVFENLLKEMDGVTEVSGVPEAYVPVIGAKISGISLDFLVARLNLSTIPDNLSLLDSDLLKNLDERCLRSLNGSRVTDEMLGLVPNVEVFRLSLRCIKLWATRKAIYSNVMGFLGGVAWAMLVARICQLYPNATAAAIVSRFFIIMYKWSWPQPVLLKQIEDGPLPVKIWNPKIYPGDRSHRMPIITPAYPSMCATHNVTVSTQAVMQGELHAGSEVVLKIIGGTESWATLFAKHDFFHRYKYYLQIIASSTKQDVQYKWSGTVESRLRHLVMKLEYVDTLTLTHPFIKGFEQTLYCLTQEEVEGISLGDIPESLAKRTKESTEGKENLHVVYATTFYIGLTVAPKQPNSGPRKLDISYPTVEFTKLVKMWDKFDSRDMAVAVRNIRGVALPEYVFEGGERTPSKPAIKRPQTDKVNESCGDGSPQPPPKKARSSLVSPGVQIPASSLPSTGNGIKPSTLAAARVTNAPSPVLPIGESTAVIAQSG